MIIVHNKVLNGYNIVDDSATKSFQIFGMI